MVRTYDTSSVGVTTQPIHVDALTTDRTADDWGLKFIKKETNETNDLH